MTRSFAFVLVGVIALAAGTATATTYSSGSGVTINDRSTADPAAASPYPSTISVSGETGVISDVNVTLTGLTHTFVPDVDVLLVGPSGAKVKLMSDAGEGATGAATNVTFTLDDEAAAGVPGSTDLSNGSTYKPADFTDGCHSAGDIFPSPAPSAPYAGTLGAFDGTDPNGSWSLYVVDDCAGDVGTISDWSLDITTGIPPHQVEINDRSTADPAAASPYPSTISVSGEAGVISDVNVTLTGLTHTFVPDVDVLLVGPSGAKVKLMSDAGEGATGAATNVTFTLDDEAAAGVPQSTDLSNGSTYKPADFTDGCHAAGDIFPSPAPSSPYAGTLGAFDGTDPNGTWSLYVVDDCAGDVGTISDWSLDITTIPEIESQITLVYSKSSVAFTGTLSSDESQCESGRAVTVFKKAKNGPDVQIGTDVTDGSGQYSVPGRKKGRGYYASVGDDLVAGMPCASAVSPTL